MATKITDRYGRVGDRYEIVDQKVQYEWNKEDLILFPRIGHTDMGRPQLHRMWMGLGTNATLPAGRPNMMDNLRFMFKYQIGWMYWRYFMWNFAGRQNGDQGFYPWDLKSGHWLSGIKPLDEARLYNMSKLPEAYKAHRANNTYFLLPFLFGLIGILFHYRKRRKEFMALSALFLITGIGIIIYSNQPPNEPRERDYVLVGSFFTYCMWIGMAVLAVYELALKKLNLSKQIGGILAVGLVLLVPLIMGFQNFDDHSRKDLAGARDYAHNFLESCDPNSIIFTYGDNDTYPLWYAQEVEGVRRDVRVINLSLIAVDWYINSLRRKVNDSPPIKMSIPKEAYRGKKRNHVFLPPNATNNERSIQSWLKFIGESHPLPLVGGKKTESYLPSSKIVISIDSQEIVRKNIVDPADSLTIIKRIPLDIKKNFVSGGLLKGDIAVLDIIGSNLWERPIYFAVTCRDKSLLGLDNYLQLEGLGLKLLPVRSSPDRMFGMVGKGRVNTKKKPPTADREIQMGQL